MIIDKLIKIKINPKVYSFYEKKGYIIPKVQSVANPSKMVYPKTAEIYVNQKDLSRGSQSYVDCVCDCCGKEYSIPFENAYASIKKFGETFCFQCRHVHTKKTNMQRYGVEYTAQNGEIKKKIRNTTMDRWGGIGFASPELSKKTKETMIQRYGVKHPSLSPEIQKKKEVSMLGKYGKKNILMITEYYQKARDKMYQNGTAPCSSQQRYIFDFLRKHYRAELNFPFSAYFLDIFLQDFLCDIEYDGSGHWLSVRTNSVSEEEFREKEIIRSYQIKKNGVTTIRSVFSNIRHRITC